MVICDNSNKNMRCVLGLLESWYKYVHAGWMMLLDSSQLNLTTPIILYIVTYYLKMRIGITFC